VQHLSAPSIYGTALEALNLSEHLSFLNVCSGTGYFSALCSQLLGTKAVHSAIEIRPELVEHSRTKLAAVGCSHVDVRMGSCLTIDPDTSMQFQRIYVGAGADENVAALLFRMLEIGGILVGPFATADGSQRLLRVERIGEASFTVRELMHVSFTNILTSLPTRIVVPSSDPFYPVEADEPTASAQHESDEVQADPVAGSSPSTKQRSRAPSISLEAPHWTPETYVRFPAAHRAAIRATLLVHNRSESWLSSLPKELVVQEILPKVPYNSFAPSEASNDSVPIGQEGEVTQEQAVREADDSSDASDDSSDGEAEREASAVEVSFDRATTRSSAVPCRLLRCL